MSKGLRADMMLLVVVTCWGFSFYFTDVASEDMAAFNLNAFRFIVAFLVIGIIMLHSQLQRGSYQGWRTRVL